MPSFENTQARATIADGIELVLFDYGQVLSQPPDPAAWLRMQSVTELSDARMHEAYWRFRHDYDRDALNGLAYWREVARHAGIALSDAQIDALLAADVDLWTRPNQPMIAWAGRLQRAGVRTAVLSNIGDAMAAGVTARLEWLKGFERCIWSCALKLAKPDPEIFRRTIELLRVMPEHILFIDDKEENIAAARGAGMQALQYSAQANFAAEMLGGGFSSLLEIGSRQDAVVQAGSRPA